MSNNTHCNEARDQAHSGENTTLVWGRAYPPWALLQSFQLSLQSWGQSEVIENNSRGVSMENVCLVGDFLNAYSWGEEHRTSSAECW